MSTDWAAQFTEQALAGVDAFIAGRPGYTRRGVEQPGQGATNRVVFARRGDELVVFKVFCEAERKERECFGLRHWRETGLVPGIIYDADPAMIVMSHVPGIYLGAARGAEGDAVWREACRETGRAVGSLTRVPLSAAGRAAFESRFYNGLAAFEAYLKRILELGRSIHARDPDFRDGFWRRSLDFIETQLDAVYSRPRILYHQDAGNLHVRQGRFMGFFDLEMCRVGCAAMQLASALGMFEDAHQGWPPFRKGWEDATGAALTPADLSAAAACRHLLCWREICRYMSYDGTPGTGYDWAEPADPARYRRSIVAAEHMLEVEHRRPNP